MLIDKWDLRNGPYLRIMDLEPVPRQCDAPASGVPKPAMDRHECARLPDAVGICASSTWSYLFVNTSKTFQRFRKKEPDAVTPLTDRLSPLGDFTATNRMVLLSGAALAVGIFNAFVAWFLLRLIGLFTNIFFFGHISTSLVSPATNNLGIFVIIIPAIGGLIIGLMARYGSDRIRGHGIPEAIEAILMGAAAFNRASRC